MSRALGLSLALTSFVFGGDALQGFEPIRHVVEQFVFSQIPTAEAPAVKVGSLDPRLRLARCAEALEAFSPAGARVLGNTTVGVRCRGPERWTVYLAVTVEASAAVVVAGQALPQGTRLEAGHLKIQKRNLSTLAFGYLVDLQQAVGMRLKRPLTSGTVLTPSMLAAPMTVRRGDLVDIIAVSGGLQVRAQGKALKDGTTGQRVPARNLASEKVVEGTVIASGIIQVSM